MQTDRRRFLKISFQGMTLATLAGAARGREKSMSCQAVIDQIVKAYHSTEKGIVLPAYEHKRGHPVLISTKYREEVPQLDPQIGLRELIHNHPEDIQEVGLDSSSILEDIDTPDDYKKLKD